ncbi:hypothetical protein [Burkholderia cepacia]|uniref:hypothetical protein n=1 Tax=Burkholderia cepacia TaxID=292 RepID=UPI0009BEEC81|nr:hypothetical protein [Burkholderia cepacia]
MPINNVLIEQIRAVCNAHVVTMGDDFELGADRLAKRILALLAPTQQPSGEVTDTERLDWLIEQQAWIQWTVRDESIRQCQVYDQDEDENYHVLSGDDRYFNTPREAIDAARAQGGDHE